MEQNSFYSETRLIIETIIKTAIDVIGTQKEEKPVWEPNVGAKVRLAWPLQAWCHFCSGS